MYLNVIEYDQHPYVKNKHNIEVMGCQQSRDSVIIPVELSPTPPLKPADPRSSQLNKQTERAPQKIPNVMLFFGETIESNIAPSAEKQANRDLNLGRSLKIKSSKRISYTPQSTYEPESARGQ